VTNLRVSVLITAYNCGDRIRRTVESTLEQEYPVFEVIVVDDGSTDNTAAVLQTFGERIRYIYQKNSGVANARNTGIQAVKGDWVAFLDDDDFWLPDKIKEQAGLILSHPEAGMAFSAYELILIGSTRRLTFSELHHYGAKVTASSSPIVADCFYHLFVENFIKTSTVLIRTDLLRKDLFKQERVPVEDRDVFIRIAAKAPVLFSKKSLLDKYEMRGSMGEERLSVVDMREIVQKENRARFKHLFREARWRALFQRAVALTKRQRITQFKSRKDRKEWLFAVSDYLAYRFFGLDLKALFIRS